MSVNSNINNLSILEADSLNSEFSEFMKETIPHLHNLVDTFKAGRLYNHYDFWKTLTSDKHILQTVVGMDIEFIDLPSQYFIPPEYQHTPEEMAFLHQEIEKLLNKQVIREVTHTPGEFVSNIFLREKRDGGFRMILNLKPPNKLVEYHKFKMETLKAVINLVTPGCFMASIDFKDAYYSVPIAKQFRKFLRFQFDNRLFEFACLPNGLSSGPRIFTKLTKPLFATLREKGHLNTVYIDDSILFGDSMLECMQNVIDTVIAALKAGFVVHPDKSIFTPAQIIEFLGFIINSILMTITLTRSKAVTLRELCEQLVSYNKPKIITVAKVVGKMVAAFPGVQHGPLFYRLLDNEKTAALKLSKGNYQAKMKLSIQAKEDLLWWIENIENSSKKIWIDNPTVVVYSDSSKTGWGGIYGNLTTGGNWSSEESLIHINILELLAAYYTLASLCRHIRNTHVRIMVDNQTALAYINNMGGRTKVCNKVTRQIWDWCLERGIWLSAA